MVNILVTGHRGYIGSALTRYLQYHPVVTKVIGYDIVDGDDIMNLEKLTMVMIRERITVVIHLAASSSVTACNENVKSAIAINGVGTRNVLAAMKRSGCTNIIYASTSSVYGNQPDLPYIESDTPLPCSAYGCTKLLGEFVIHNYFEYQQQPGNYLIYRMFNVVGTCGYSDIDNTTHAGYDRLFGALQSGKLTIYGDNYNTSDGTCERDYISLKDVCAAYLQGITKLVNNNNLRAVVNICTGIPITVKQIITSWNNRHDKISAAKTEYELYNQLPYITYTIGERRLGDPAIVYGSNNEAKQLLNWHPIRKIDDIINDIAIDKTLNV